MYNITREQQLNCDISTAWTFFSSPKNLALITPPKMRFGMVDDHKNKEIFAGLTIKYTLRPLCGLLVKWTTLITQVDHQKSFTDAQDKGPFRYWNHHHQFLINEQGVLMKDNVDYDLPFGAIGSLVHAAVVRKKLEELFNYRQHIISQLFQD